MSEQDQTLVIAPEQGQLHRFIIWHTHTYVAGSQFRMEQFARWLDEKSLEVIEKGYLTLDNKYLIESWQSLVESNFVIDEDYP
jgi:hypothetical protein